MPKVRILSGDQAGAIVEMPLAEAQAGYCTGYLELYVEPEVDTKSKPEFAAPKSKGKKKEA